MGHRGPPVKAPSWARRMGPGACAVLLVACAAKGPGPLYLWETFPRQQYEVLLREGYNPGDQIRLLETQAEKARASNAALPPGFRAHLGLLHLGAGNPGRAREMWAAEKLAFPESAAYMDRLLRKLDAPAKPGEPGNPA